VFILTITNFSPDNLEESSFKRESEIFILHQIHFILMCEKQTQQGNLIGQR